jgi:hypothetical protein
MTMHKQSILGAATGLLALLASGAVMNAQSPCIAQFQELYGGTGTVVSAAVDENLQAAVLVANTSGTVTQCLVYGYAPGPDRWTQTGTIGLVPALATTGSIPFTAPGVDIEAGRVLVWGRRATGPATLVATVYVDGGFGGYIPFDLRIPAATVSPPGFGPSTSFGTYGTLMPLNGRVLAFVGDAGHLRPLPSGFNQADGAVYGFDVGVATGPIVVGGGPFGIAYIERIAFPPFGARFGERVAASGATTLTGRLIVGAPSESSPGVSSHGGAYIYEVALVGTLTYSVVPVFSFNQNFPGSRLGSEVAISATFGFASTNPLAVPGGFTRVFRRQLSTAWISDPSISYRKVAVDQGSTRVVGLRSTEDTIEHLELQRGPTPTSPPSWVVRYGRIRSDELGVTMNPLVAAGLNSLNRIDCGGALDDYLITRTGNASLDPNEDGLIGDLTLTGSFKLSDNNLTLDAVDLPPNKRGILLVTTFGQRPTATSGVALLNGPVPLGAPLLSSPSGTFSTTIDLTTLPVAAFGIETWIDFQIFTQDDLHPTGLAGSEALGIQVQ